MPRLRTAIALLRRHGVRLLSAAVIDRLLLNIYCRQHRSSKLVRAIPAISPGETADDRRLVERIIRAYNYASDRDDSPALDSMWKGFFEKHHADIHRALVGGSVEAVGTILRDPGSSDLFYGFDALATSLRPNLRSRRVRLSHARNCLGGLARFAEAIGAIRIDRAEAFSWSNIVTFEPEELLNQIEKKTGCSFTVPNPYPDEHGLKTSRGVMSYRVPQALYQACRIKQLLSGIDHPRILEIGAGLGRTALYAHELGIKNYTIIDLPMTGVSQSYFLGRVLGENSISLFGESFADDDVRVKILPPMAFLNGGNSYDIILNVDSMTEMNLSHAARYWRKIRESARYFLSINHEGNSFTMQDLMGERSPHQRVTRAPYWMRAGYTEEFVDFA